MKARRREGRSRAGLRAREGLARRTPRGSLAHARWRPPGSRRREKRGERPRAAARFGVAAGEICLL
jgi:hypothetical protein